MAAELLPGVPGSPGGPLSPLSPLAPNESPLVSDSYTDTSTYATLIYKHYVKVIKMWVI